LLVSKKFKLSHNITYLRFIKSGVTWTMLSSLHLTLLTISRKLLIFFFLATSWWSE